MRPLVRRFDIEVGHCSQCRRRIQGRHPLQTSDGVGGGPAHSWAPVWSRWSSTCTRRGGLPLAKVADLLQTPLRPVGDAGEALAHLLHRAARDARPAYEQLREQVRNAPVVTVDETGWRVGGVGHWLWAAVTPTTTVYAICAGRGFDDAQAVLGADFDGVLVRDGWVVYRSYTNGEHQSCLQHLRRRCEELLEDHPHCGWAAQVQDTLQGPALALRDRRNAGGISDHGLATVRGRLLAQLSRLIDNPPAARPTPSASPRTWLANSAPSSPSCGTRRSTPPTGAPNKPSGPPSSSARCAAATAPARAPTPSRSSPASYAPHDNATSTCPRCSPRCCAPPESIVPDVFGLPPPSASTAAPQRAH